LEIIFVSAGYLRKSNHAIGLLLRSDG